MDTPTLLENNNLMVIRAVENLNEALWDIPGACGSWSVKDIVAHLASYEHLLVDALQLVLAQKLQPTPSLSRWMEDAEAFNSAEVKARRYDTAQHVEDEYQDTQVQASSLLKQIPAATIHQPGTIPWYKQDCCLADLITLLTQHIQEHCSQIVDFRRNADPALKKSDDNQ